MLADIVPQLMATLPLSINFPRPSVVYKDGKVKRLKAKLSPEQKAKLSPEQQKKRRKEFKAAQSRRRRIRQQNLREGFGTTVNHKV